MLQQRGRRGCDVRENELGLQGGEFLRESLHRLEVCGYRPASVDLDVATLCPPELPETLPERRDLGLRVGVAFSISHQHTNPPHPFALLRACRERPRDRRAAEQRDELAAL